MAESVGVSQPYVYRLFGTKKDLFLAAAGHVRRRVLGAFQEGAEAGQDEALEAMGQSYNLQFFRREEMMLLLQGFAASEDPEVKEAMVSGFAEIWRFVQEATGSSDEEVWNFMAAGMMLTVDAAIGLMSRLGKEEWLEKYMRDEL
jgi:AcrR family transcriptional regulator